ncbi:MAG: hypothetical protein ABGY96_16270 [bacterium]|nr:hypothetical protein [Gammaproteobacteria bacterium]HIL96515.1 hypothetical protein [Pseudomonadales bacterium]
MLNITIVTRAHLNLMLIERQKKWLSKLVLILWLFTPYHILPVQAERALGTLSGSVTITKRNGEIRKNHSDTVVFLHPTGDENSLASPHSPPKISHKGSQFSPRVLPIVKNSAVDFYNDDNIFHNVFSLSIANTFDLGIYPQGSSKIVTFEKFGLVKIYCNIHPKMVASILVLNSPLYSLTDASGTYKIKGIPNGEYILSAWSELGGELSKKLYFQGGEKLIENFSLANTRLLTQHKNKFGKNYNSKYQ